MSNQDGLSYHMCSQQATLPGPTLTAPRAVSPLSRGHKLRTIKKSTGILCCTSLARSSDTLAQQKDPLPEGSFGRATIARPGESVADYIKSYPQSSLAQWALQRAEDVYARSG